MPRSIVFVLAIIVAWPVHALQSCRAASGSQLRPLVELYTSEGCDSCPARRSLAGGAISDGRHRFACERARVSRRLLGSARLDGPLRDTAIYPAPITTRCARNGASFVYTPQVLVQGREALNWQQGGATDAVAAAAGRAAGAAIALTVTSSADALQVRAIATVPDTMLRKQAVLWLGLYRQRSRHRGRCRRKSWCATAP
jgi:hypothetical protein